MKRVQTVFPFAVGFLLLSPGLWGTDRSPPHFAAIPENTPKARDAPLHKGDPAPDFEAVVDVGGKFHLGDYFQKKNVVIFFYAADMTPGCVRQATGYRDNMKELVEKGVKVVGISGDSPKNHRIFKKAHRLNFTLLSDEKGEIAKLFGVPVKRGGSTTKVVDGKKITLIRGVTCSRWTFVIDKNGRIAEIDKFVKTASDSKRVLKLIDKLSAGPQVGDAAPKFRATADGGQTWNSSKYVGKKILVVYFYPADMTSACTKQACGFRDDLRALKKLGAEVVGVSGDSVQNHQLFKKKYDLNFTLLSDEKGALAKLFGVPVTEGGSTEIKVDGESRVLKRGVTASRWTFVIGRDGKIALVNRRVRPTTDSKKALRVVEKLAKREAR